MLFLFLFCDVCRLQTVLMELQQGQLDDLASWLTSMEERVEKQQNIGADLEAIKAQVEEHKVRKRDWATGHWTSGGES